MALHPMLIHFPIGMIYLAAGASVIGTLLLIYKDLLSNKDQEKIYEQDYLGKIDFLILVSLIITLVGLIFVIYTGFLDASLNSRTDLIDLLKPWEVIDGFKTVLTSNLLTFKMVFAFVVFFLLILTLFMRHYYLKHSSVKSIFNLELKPLYAIVLLILTDMTIITLVGAVGGIYAYRHSIIQDIPIINLFLPETYGFFLLSVFVISVLLIEIMIFVNEKQKKIK